MSKDGVTSPLGILRRDVYKGDREATEVLVLTFNQDLAFLEKAALGWMEQLGARVTIIGDASVADHDPYAVHRAGVSYLPGRAVCGGAFHPKLFVIAGEDDATVAIGSGNLTLAGWHGNDECWSIHHADSEAGSAVVPATARFLDLLAERVTLSDGAPEALHRVAALLRRRPGTDDTATLVSSLEQPLIEQLPLGPVDELCLYAPFHDPNAVAVGRLVERFNPTTVRLAVQPALTHIDGALTAPLLEGEGELTTLSNSPYRHGKLIEWSVGDQRWALTGSANLSAAALLKSVGHGGNVELGVVAPVAESLFPDGEVADFDALRTISFPESLPKEITPSVVLLSATVAPEGLAVRFARPLPESVTVQLSPLGAPPDQWMNIGEAPAGEAAISFIESASGGSRVRARMADGTVTAFVPVADPHRLLRARRSSKGLRRPPPIEEVLGWKPQILEQFWSIIDDLRAQERMTLPSKSPTTHSPGGDGSFEVGDWEDYLDRCQAKLGSATIAFAFGLPFLNQTSGGVVSIDWDDDDPLGDELGALEEDTPDEFDDDSEPSVSAAEAIRRASEPARKRLRDVAAKVVAAVADRDPHERLLATRLVLTMEAGDLWPPGDDDWANLLLRSIDSFPVDDAPDEYEVAAGSLAAIVLSVVRTELPAHHTNALKTHHHKSGQRLAHLLVAADPDRIESYVQGIDARYGWTADVDEIMGLCALLVEDDPIELALDRLLDQGIVAEAEGAVIQLLKPVPQPLLPSYAVLSEAVDATPIAVRCAGTGPGPNQWALLLWSKPDLFVVQPGKTPPAVMCRHYRYGPGSSPHIDISNDGKPDPGRLVDQSIADQPLLPAAVKMLHELGIEVETA